MPKSSNLSSRATILVVLLTIIGWVLVFSPSTVSAVKSVIVSPDATTVPLDTTIPILSTDQNTQATALLAQDKDLQKLLHGSTYKISEIGPWTDSNNNLLAPR
jgi:hypothetical protein